MNLYMSLLNDGEAAGAGLVADVVPEDAGPVVVVVPVVDVDLAGDAVPVVDVGLAVDVVLVEGAVPAGDAERDRYLSSHSGEVQSH